MTSIADVMRQLDTAVESAVREIVRAEGVRGAGDEELLLAATAAASLHRRMEGVLVEITAEIAERDDRRPHDERLTTMHGCRNLSELLQRAMLCSPQAAAAYLRAARVTRRDVSPSSGETLPAELPILREALLDGVIGVDAMGALIGPLADLRMAVGHDLMRRAERELASAARGVDAPPAGWQDLRLLAQVLVAYLDPDGAEPRDTRALRKRGITLGTAVDGVVPIRGNLLPDVAAQVQRIFDSILNPKVQGCESSGPRFREVDESIEDGIARGSDSRSRAQKQHDALATALSVAARSGELPTIGGTAPTLIVSVRHEDLVSGTGRADVDGADQPVSLDVARQVACTGAVQRVVCAENGRILSIGVTDRVFNHHQRRAITLRDGNCIIPGCGVAAAWCEIHHVQEHSRGGSTHTDNGVLLCWFHHRTIDSGQWSVRMNTGVPEVRGPAWWDKYRTWQPVTSSRIRKLDRLSG